MTIIDKTTKICIGTKKYKGCGEEIDHIIPQSLFNFTTMDCEEFHQCWALSNLRPLSAKLNLLEGLTRARHKRVA